MLTDKEITVIEGVCLAIDGCLMAGLVCKQLIQSVKQKDINFMLI